MRNRTQRRGFSIVELLIAVAVLVIGAYGIYNQFLAVRPASSRHLALAEGRLLAHQQLTELRAAPYDALAQWSPPDSFTPIFDQPRFHWRADLTQRNDGILEIAVTVGWNPSDEAAQEFPAGHTVTVKGLRNP